MDNAIIALVGPSGSGKSTLITEMLRRFPKRLAVVRSTTTRAKRGAEDDMYYDFVTVPEFEAMDAADRFVKRYEYAGNLYGTDRAHIDALFAAGKCGINAFLPDAMVPLRAAGYSVIVIKVIPKDGFTSRSRTRANADKKRSKIPLAVDFPLENSFAHDGLDLAVGQLSIFLTALLSL